MDSDQLASADMDLFCFQKCYRFCKSYVHSMFIGLGMVSCQNSKYASIAKMVWRFCMLI